MLLLLLLLLLMPVVPHDQLRLSLDPPRKFPQQQIPAPLICLLHLDEMLQFYNSGTTTAARLSN